MFSFPELELGSCFPVIRELRELELVQRSLVEIDRDCTSLSGEFFSRCISFESCIGKLSEIFS